MAGVVNDQLKNLLKDDGDLTLSNTLQAHLLHLRGSLSKKIGVFDITVKERPFGMHLRRGSLVVEEVFPGFPAEKSGVYPGCLIEKIAGDAAKQGTWMEVF